MMKMQTKPFVTLCQKTQKKAAPKGGFLF